MLQTHHPGQCSGGEAYGSLKEGGGVLLVFGLGSGHRGGLIFSLGRPSYCMQNRIMLSSGLISEN